MKLYLRLSVFYLIVISSDSHSVKFSPYIDIEIITVALEEFKNDCGYYPSNKAGLTSLVNSNLKCWHGPYIKKSLLLDRYGNSFVYKNTNLKNNFILISKGGDQTINTFDDVSNNDDANKIRMINGSLKCKESELSWTKIYSIYIFLILLVVSKNILAVLKSKFFG